MASHSVPSDFSQTRIENEFGAAKQHAMRNAIGFVIVLWALSHFFGSAMTELNTAATKSFQALGTAADVASVKLIEKQ